MSGDRGQADAVDHVDYDQVEHLTYCYGPITIKPGQNVIRLRPAIDGNGQKLWPQVPGYVTRFDPEFIYADGTVPRVDVLHLHHAVWLVNDGPQFAVGEEKTIQQLPKGFGWPSDPGDSWVLNDMLHDLVAQAGPGLRRLADRLRPGDLDPTTARSSRWRRSGWTSPATRASIRSSTRCGPTGTTAPTRSPIRRRRRTPCRAESSGRAQDSHGCLGSAQRWTPNHDVTLIETAGHLHPGGLNTQLRDTRGGNTNTLFTSDAHYYEPAGEVSWDVAMRAMPAQRADWRVKVKAATRSACTRPTTREEPTGTR